MAYSGKFLPIYPHKYEGDWRNIIYRSSWERTFMDRIDKRSDVISWSSEEIVIPYLSPVDGKYHRYFPDIKMSVLDKNNKTQTYIIEIKPYNQTVEPTPQKRITKRYITEVTTWGVNQAKWKYAKEFCKDRGWIFTTATEKDFGFT